ncbi:MAG: DNA repair protein RecO [Alphaproteobacteria bacterium]|nr:DNA repair protein RecO [Alphaproteobacteria bacterium]
MQWSDEAIVVGVRPHGETAAIVEIFTRQHGRCLGLVHGGRSRRLRPTLQIGNAVDVVWKGRLAEHLGTTTVELRHGHAAEAMDDPTTLSALTSLCALLHLVAEREPHPNLFEVTQFVLGFLDQPEVWPALVVRWELSLLDELGFGLDLSACAATGRNDQLIYVSPKTGRAVSASAGEPYKDRLLSLPGFLNQGQRGAVVGDDLLTGFHLTGHFLQTRVLTPRDVAMPTARERLLTLLKRRIDV